MPIVEYKNERTNEGIQKPGYILSGGRYRAPNYSMIGYVEENPRYWVPTGIKSLSKEDFIKRQMEHFDEDVVNGEYVKYQEFEAEVARRVVEENGNEIVTESKEIPELEIIETIKQEEWWSTIYDNLLNQWQSMHEPNRIAENE